MSDVNSKFDLRKKLNVGETYKFDVCGGFMCYQAIYMWNGSEFERVLSHKNVDLCSSFEKKLSKKEFKILVEGCFEREFSYLGVLRKEQ